MKIKKIFILLSFYFLFIACSDGGFENKFDESPSQRIQNKIEQYKNVLSSAPYGWKMNYSLGGKAEYLTYQMAYFDKDLTVKLHSPNPQLPEPIKSDYSIRHEADMELVFSSFNENITIFSYPSQANPKGYGGDVEFSFKSINEAESEIILKGKVYGGTLILRKAKEEFRDFSKLQSFITELGNQRTAKYMGLVITDGLDGASDVKPINIGLDLSPVAKAADYAYNYKGKFEQGRKMLYFTHEGMGLSSPINIDGQKIQEFKYDEQKDRFEVINSEIKGYLACTDLPVYFVPGIVDEFLDHYSLWMRASFGQVNNRYLDMKRTNPEISSVVFVTDYKRRIPLFDSSGQPILDVSHNPDYEFGEKLGDGFLFSFEGYDQFYFYFVPVEVVKLEGDRLRFKSVGGHICKPKNTLDEARIKDEISQNSEFKDFIDLLCSEKGWYIKRTVESGQIDWDFISQEKPKDDYFYTRLK